MLTIITHDKKFLETVVGMKDTSSPYYAIQFRCSKLDKNWQSNSSFDIENLAAHFNSYDGYLFVCADNDFIIILRNSSAKHVKESIHKIIAEINKSISHKIATEILHADNFSNHYTISTEWKNFFALCKKKVNEATRHSKRPKLTPTLLVEIEKAMVDIDLTHLLRTQPVCTVLDQKANPVFDEVYVSIEHLKKVLMRDNDFTGNKALFRCLTELLDKHVLNLLQLRPKLLPKNIPISLNLNIETIMSDAFMQFTQMVKSTLWVALIIEINVADIFNDIYAYYDARDQVRKLGYKVCIDGINDATFELLNRSLMGFDLVKLQWNNDVKENMDTEENFILAKAIARCGANRVILCHCDDRSAIEYGRTLGISLFQGRYVDWLINPAAKTVN